MKRQFGLKLLLLWCFVPLASSAYANVRLPAIVGDNMILQQRIGAPIWGWANAGIIDLSSIINRSLLQSISVKAL
jgi:hypothetical protein